MSNRIGYFVSYLKNNKFIAAVPVDVQDGIIKLLRVPLNLPNVFKDFPLIGSSDTKWNAVINSREFYPN